MCETNALPLTPQQTTLTGPKILRSAFLSNTSKAAASVLERSTGRMSSLWSVNFVARERSILLNCLLRPKQHLLASYSAFDFQPDVVVCVNGGAKLYNLLDNIEARPQSSTTYISSCPHLPPVPFSQTPYIALNATVTSRIVRLMMSMSSATARTWTLL